MTQKRTSQAELEFVLMAAQNPGTANVARGVESSKKMRVELEVGIDT